MPPPPPGEINKETGTNPNLTLQVPEALPTEEAQIIYTKPTRRRQWEELEEYREEWGRLGGQTVVTGTARLSPATSLIREHWEPRGAPSSGRKDDSGSLTRNKVK